MDSAYIILFLIFMSLLLFVGLFIIELITKGV